MDLTVIIPTFNEEDTIGKFLENLQAVLADLKSSCEVIVVDDGSKDSTYSIASGISGVKVVRHPYNKGNGASVKTGIQESKGRNIVIIDADGQHDPMHIPELLDLLNEYDLVVGARDTFGIGRRGFGNKLVSKLAGYLSGIPIPDLTSGYRAFKKEKVLEFIHLFPNGFSMPSTSTMAFAVSGYSVKFIGIKAAKRQGGTSTIRVFRDGMKFLVLIVRMVSLFHPLKIYVPASIFLLLMGCLWFARNIVVSSKFTTSLAMLLTPTTTMLFLGSIFFFLFGLLADQVAQTRLSIGKINKLLLQKNNKHVD